MLVSVIIPYYKKKFFIKSCINSVIKQNYKKLEILIVYDDESLQDLHFLKKIISKDKRIKIIINKKNLGAGESRNIGIKQSTGKYIAFIDADDKWNKKKISKQLAFMKKTKCKLSHTGYTVSKLNKKKIYRPAKDFNNIKDLLKSCDIGLSTVMVLKSVFNNNNKFPKIKTKEDFVLWLKFLNKKIKIRGIDENLVIWRETKNSLSSSTLQKFYDGFNVYYKFLNFNFLKSLYFLFMLSYNYLSKN